MPTQLDSRQVVLRAAQAMLGSAANDALSTIFPRIDAEMAKLFEDRNVLLTDGGIITFTGTQIQFTENLNLVLNQKISGAAPQVFNLGQATVTLANNEMLWAVIDRTAGTAVLAQGTTMPAVNATNQEVFLLVKRVDAGDGTQRIYWRTGAAFNAGQSARLGSAGSGSGGSGVGDDLDALLYRASFRDGFDEGTTDSKSAVDASAGKTDPNTYSAAKALFQLSYDASKTIAAGTTTTNINLSAVAAFTVKIGDIVISGSQARRITAVASQQSFTTEAFSVAPTLASQVTVSQAVYTKDIYNLPVDGNALSAAFSGQTFSDIMVDYEDTSTVGDAIFDVNVAPVIAFSASNDNTNFTDIKNRPTLETDTVQSVALPSAGTALYLRFFALKTSGSGSVNILGYRAFMQKTTQASAGGIVNSAYAFTNGVGTPVNCSVSLVGGKTVITLNWQYAVGVLPGTSASSIEVWVNGQKAPRFINTTLTPDLSFLESSPNVITLDRDYSQQNLSVEVFQRTQIIDTSTTNSSAISFQQEIMANAFQGFVATNKMVTATNNAGTPVAGTFYSTITNRAAMIDPTQDLYVAFGPRRTMTQYLHFMPSEFGPNGEAVKGVANDTVGHIRFVGTWNQFNDTYGPYCFTSVLNDYVEVTFYGTGLNILTVIDNNVRDVRVSIDGGAESANIYPGTAQSNLLGGRNYPINQYVVAASGLALGVHTAKIRLVSGVNNNIYGFEVVNNASTLLVNPGVSYVGGQKLVLSSQQTPAYNSAFDTGSLGTRGGRVVVYQKSDGSIGKAVNSAGSQLNYTSADHSNEEVARIFSFREFGAGRTDDFSLVFSAANRGFTLDDNVTTLYAQNHSSTNFGLGDTLVLSSGSGDFWQLTFVGTGLDIINARNATGTITYTVQVDGITTVTSTSIGGSGQNNQIKIVSGLPYGTHTVRITATSGGTTMAVNKFIVYQPKKPAIPTGAVELADYNVVANYDASAITTAGNQADNPQIPQGVIRKYNFREVVLTGTFADSGIVGGAVGATGQGHTLSTSVNGSVQTYYFFGTGFVTYFNRSSAQNIDYTIAIDGSLNATGVSLTTGSGTNLGGGSYRTLANAGQDCGPVRFQFTGLTLGMHVVTVTKTAGADNFNTNGIDVITPIHSYRQNALYGQQNTLNLGSVTVSDSRKNTPVKEKPATRRNVSTAGKIATSSTTSTSFVPLAEMGVTHVNSSGQIRVTYNVASFGPSVNDTHTQVFIDGIGVGSLVVQSVWASGSGTGNGANTQVFDVAPGAHKVEIYWRSPAGGALNATGGACQITVEEV